MKTLITLITWLLLITAAAAAEPIAIVHVETGRVQTFVRPDVPEGWTPPEGYTAIPRAQLPAGYQMEQPAVPAVPTWTDAGEGHTGLVLAIDADSQAKFTADVTGYQAKLITGGLDLDTDTTVIRDAAGAEHTLTIRQYLRLLGRLHDALRAAWQSAD